MDNYVISSREQEILHLIAHERNSREIAEELFISPHTVLTHRKNLLMKMDAKNTAGLVRKGFELGILHLRKHVALISLLILAI